MLYRELGKTGEKVSILGFGAMRLPTTNNKPSGEIDLKKAENIVNYGIENGINFLDTAYSYHADEKNKTNSEEFLGNFLETQNREKLLISTKLPSWDVNTREDMDKFLNEQLNRLKLDYTDVYLLHSLNENDWRRLEKNNVLEFLDTIKSDGKVKYLGFSFHDEFDLFMEIMDSYDWDIILTQLNYLDENYQAGLSGVKYASGIGVGTLIMEPLRGGSLANNIPSEIQDVWNKTKVQRTPAEWAFRYLWDIAEVDCVLSGMSSIEDVKENIEIASEGRENSLSPEEKETIKEIASLYRDRIKLDCTECSYCMPCPQGVNIPQCFKEYNLSYMLNNKEATRMQYYTQLEDGERASSCTYCEECRRLCPQMIDIPEELKNVASLFKDEGK